VLARRAPRRARRLAGVGNHRASLWFRAPVLRIRASLLRIPASVLGGRQPDLWRRHTVLRIGAPLLRICPPLHGGDGPGERGLLRRVVVQRLLGPGCPRPAPPTRSDS
jgi:hypothetical protein